MASGARFRAARAMRHGVVCRNESERENKKKAVPDVDSRRPFACGLLSAGYRVIQTHHAVDIAEFIVIPEIEVEHGIVLVAPL